MSAVTFNKKGRIGYITLNRPEKLNTVNRQLAEELLDNLQEFERDDTLKACFRLVAPKEPVKGLLAPAPI